MTNYTRNVVAHMKLTIMKKSFFIAFLSISLLSLTSCGQIDPNAEIEDGVITGEEYHSKEIGWTFLIPKGWEIISKEKVEENTKNGLEAIESIVGEVDYSGLKQLLNLQKDQFNSFLSTREAFKIEYPNEWEENNNMLKEIIYAAYKERGMKADTSSSVVIIDSVKFNVFHIKIYTPDKKKVLLSQDMYGSYINGYDFGVNLNYNNENDKKQLLNSLLNSKFKK